jgi:hypothetical protein
MELEQRGVEFDYGDAVITMARAGGSNRRYKAALAKEMRPHRAAIDADTIREDTILPMMLKPFVEHVILNWQTRNSKGELVAGIESPEGVDAPPLPFTHENAIAFLKECPELFFKLQSDAVSPKGFLKTLENAAKN